MQESQVTDNQIADWKKKHGDIFEFDIDGRKCWLRKPDRNTLGYAMKRGQSNPLGVAEVILESCWLGGDEAIKTNDDLFLSISTRIDALIEIKQAEVKKL